MSKTFSQESSEAFLNFAKSALRKTKKLASVFQMTALKRTSKKTPRFICLLKKETCWHSPTSFEYGFLSQICLQKQLKDSP